MMKGGVGGLGLTNGVRRRFLTRRMLTVGPLSVKVSVWLRLVLISSVLISFGFDAQVMLLRLAIVSFVLLSACWTRGISCLMRLWSVSLGIMLLQVRRSVARSRSVRVSRLLFGVALQIVMLALLYEALRLRMCTGLPLVSFGFWEWVGGISLGCLPGLGR